MARKSRSDVESIERQIRERLGEAEYRMLVRRLIGAVRAFETLADVAPELLPARSRNEADWTTLLPPDMHWLMSLLLERFDKTEVEPRRPSLSLVAKRP